MYFVTVVLYCLLQCNQLIAIGNASVRVHYGMLTYCRHCVESDDKSRS